MCFDYKWIPRLKKVAGKWTDDQNIYEENKMKKECTVVTGILGQTGSYMAELLLERGHQVYGICRPRTGGLIKDNIRGILSHPSLTLLEIDICDHVQIAALFNSLKPDYWFHFAAQSHVQTSFTNPVSTFEINANATIAQLHALNEFSHDTKYYFAATSEMFGGENCPEEGYSEDSALNPRSPYAISKVAAFNAVKNYRDAYKIFACSGMLFNHESPKRGETFVTRKMTKGIAAIKSGLQEKIKLGNLESFRDFGHARDYCKAIWLIMQQERPSDYVIATGESVKISSVLEYLCELADLNYEDVYEVDSRFMRPSDVPFLKGNPAKAKRVLGWEPEYTWKSLLKEMYEHDLKEIGGSQ